MLFKSTITYETTLDQEKLSEQLYIFLNDFVPARLRYESRESREDCVQDTIMHLLKRFEKLSQQERTTFNLERWFYNRANSYVSYWLRLKYLDRERMGKYIEHYEYFTEQEVEFTEIDHELLVSIIDKYALSYQSRANTIEQAVKQLEKIGFVDSRELRAEVDEFVDSIVITIVSEYLVKEVEGDRTN